MSNNGEVAPKKPERVIDRIRFAIQQSLFKTVEIVRGPNRYRFVCETRTEVFRAKTLFSKEPGTVEWIMNHVKNGDVFFDIGANIGLYSVLASVSTGRSAKVYAFEPHAGNFVSLIKNVRANGLENSVTVSSIALSDQTGVAPFHHLSWTTGSSGSQLLDQNSDEVSSDASITEAKMAIRIDDAMDNGWLPYPDVVKIDVDGREPKILQGMSKLMASAKAPRMIQVEINPGDRVDIYALMEAHGYTEFNVHFTAGGARKMQRGRTIDQIAYNVIFERGKA